jgi:cytidine deaminase
MCRQVLREFCSLDMPIFMVPADYPQMPQPGEEDQGGYIEGGVKETTLGQLLPDSFGPGDLELPRRY